MNHTFPREYYKVVLAPKKPRTFSEHMTKLRRPFLCDEKYAKPLNFNANKVKLNPNGEVGEDLKTLVGTKQGFKQNMSEADNFNANDLDEGTENSFGIKNDVKNVNGGINKINLNKRLDIGDSTSEMETFAISDCFTDDSGNKISYFLESNTSIENLSFSDSLKPLKNSTFIIQGEANKNDTYSGKENETFIFEDNYNNSEIINGEAKLDTTNFSDFIKNNSVYSTRSLQVPLVTINGKKLISNRNEIEMAIFPKCEENEKLKAKIVQMELYNQIEIKDKVMSHLLELSQSPGFPQLKHLCYSECEKDSDGICKKIKRLGNYAKLQESHYGALKYIWSTIKYPFAPVSPKNRVKVKGLVKANPVTKAYKQLKNKKENCKKLEDNKHKLTDMEAQSYRITDFVWESHKKTLIKSKARKNKKNKKN